MLDVNITKPEAVKMLGSFGYSVRSAEIELGLPNRRMQVALSKMDNVKNKLFIIGCLTILKEDKQQDEPVEAVVTTYDHETGKFTEFNSSEKVKLWRVKNNRTIPHIRLEIEGEQSIKIYNPMAVVYPKK